MSPAELLRHHVTGAIERGEAAPIVEVPARKPRPVRMPKRVEIDNGYILITTAEARELADNNKLPDHGREQLIVDDGKHYWLARTMHDGKQRWSIRRAVRAGQFGALSGYILRVSDPGNFGRMEARSVPRDGIPFLDLQPGTVVKYSTQWEHGAVRTAEISSAYRGQEATGYFGTRGECFNSGHVLIVESLPS